MSEDARSVALKRSYDVNPQPPVSTIATTIKQPPKIAGVLASDYVVLDPNEWEVSPQVTPRINQTPTVTMPLEIGTTQSTVEMPIAPVDKAYRPTIVSLAYAREAAMSMVPILGTVRYAQYASKDGFTAGEIGWVAGSAALDLLVLIPIARIGAGVGASTIRAVRAGSAATRTARVASTTVRTTGAIGPTIRTGNTQVRLVTNLRNAIDSGNASKIRVAATKLENFGNTTAVHKIRGGIDISKKAAYIRENADVLARTKIPASVKETLNRLDDAFAPYREGRQRLLHPEGARAAAETARPGVRAKTAVVPITREEAKGFGLSSKQVDDIFSKVGDNRAAYMREAESIRSANLKSVFDEINDIINGVKRQRVPHKRGMPSTRTAVNRARARATASARTRAKVKARREQVKAKKAEADTYGAALHKLRVDPMLNPVKGKSPSKWQPFKPGEITKARLNQLTSQWNKMRADLAVNQMITARLLTPALANNAAAITRILNASSPQIKTRAMEELSPALRTALQTNLSKAAVIAQTETNTRIKAFTKAEALAKIATLTETLAKITTKAQVWTRAGLSIVTLNRLATETRAAIKIYTKVVTKTGVITKTRVQAGRVITKPTSRPSTKKRFLLRPLLPPREAYKKLSLLQKQGAVAWKQGFIYKLIYPPYGQDNIINSREPIAGVKIVSGAKSAYESIAKAKDKRGLLPSRITRDMGIMDIQVSTPEQGRGKPRLQYKRDIKQKTKTTPNAGMSSMRK